jgi:hypothetical protein
MKNLPRYSSKEKDATNTSVILQRLKSGTVAMKMLRQNTSK